MKLKRRCENTSQGDESHYCYGFISGWRVYHFHDTKERHLFDAWVNELKAVEVLHA